MTKPITNAQLKFNCPVNWDSMEDTVGGKNCHQCQKKVFDLTNCTQDQMDVILAQNNYNICAKFTAQQMAPQPINISFWKKWASAAIVLLGFNLFNNKAVAQNNIPVKDQKTLDNITFIGEVSINLDGNIHAKPAMGVEVFSKLIRDIVGKNGALEVIISIDTAGNLKKFVIPDKSIKNLGLDSAIQKKIEEAFRSAKWTPANKQNRIINDNEFSYQVLFLSN